MRATNHGRIAFPAGCPSILGLARRFRCPKTNSVHWARIAALCSRSIATSTEMKKITVRRYTIRQLWRHCDDGVFAVPEIQREFVWDPRRASDLLDSIARQLPVGSLLIWKTSADRKHLLRHAQQILPPHDPRNSGIWFLIDGQQRLSVLYRARYGHEVENDRGRLLNFSKLCLSFDKRSESLFQFVRKPTPKLHTPVVDLLAPSWKRRLRHLSKGRLNDAAKIRSRICRYSIPVIFVETNDVEEVRESFLRINSGGLRISKADRAFSKAARLDLRRLIKEVRSTLPARFDELDPRTIQAAMALIKGQKETRSKAVETVIARLEREEIEDGKVSRKFTRDWRNISVCIQKAVDYFIYHLKLPNASFLPSELMVPVLAYFFHANHRAQPSSKQRREIRKWFWATAVGRRYTGRGYYDNIRNDVDFFGRLGRKRPGNFILSARIPADEIRRADFTSSGSLGAAFFLLLAHKAPRYLDANSEFPLGLTAALANRQDKHHIFPRALLLRNGFSTRESNSLTNICYLVAEENQVIGSNKPFKYLAQYRRRRHFATVMRSHLIPHHRNGALWSRSVRSAYRKFQRERLALICAAFDRVAGMKLFSKG